MKPRSLSLFSLVLLPGLALSTGCERRTVVVEVPATPVPEPIAKTTTLETTRLGHAIDAFDREPTAENKAAVNKAFARLDEEIGELEGRVAKTEGRNRDEAATKLKNLASYRNSESLRFTAAEAKAPFTSTGSTPVDDRSGETKVRDGAREVGGSIKDAAKEVGGAIKDAVRR